MDAEKRIQELEEEKEQLYKLLEDNFTEEERTSFIIQDVFKIRNLETKNKALEKECLNLRLQNKDLEDSNKDLREQLHASYSGKVPADGYESEYSLYILKSIPKAFIASACTAGCCFYALLSDDYVFWGALLLASISVFVGVIISFFINHAANYFLRGNVDTSKLKINNFLFDKEKTKAWRFAFIAPIVIVSIFILLKLF